MFNSNKYHSQVQDSDFRLKRSLVRHSETAVFVTTVVDYVTERDGSEENVD